MAKRTAKSAPPGPPKVQPGQALLGQSTPRGDPQAGPYEQIGVSGLKVFSGIVNEEYLVALRGDAGRRIYREMAESDSIAAAVLNAIGLMLRAVDWRFEPADDSAEAEKEAEFAKSLFDDMSHTFEDMIGESLSMLIYGWAYHEIILKIRRGPDETNAKFRSKFTDGRIGIRKLPIRSQETLNRWELQDDGGIAGMWQQPPAGGPVLMIPIQRALHFRTTSKRNSPEGQSILRSAYRDWYLKKLVEDYETCGVERELAGLPVATIPAKYLAANADPADKAVLSRMQQIVRDLKFNQQGGVVIPSDVYKDATGNPTSVPMIDLKLLTTGGRRAIDTSPIITRHQQGIARSALADFIMLGADKGSYALSKNKSELFLRACEAYLKQIATVINRFCLPRIFEYNNIDQDLMPEAKPGDIAPTNLEELGSYLNMISGAGAPLFPNQELSEYLAEVAGLPAPPEDLAQGLVIPPGTMQPTDANGNPLPPKPFGGGRFPGGDNNPDNNPNNRPPTKPGGGSPDPSAAEAKKYDPDQPRAPAGDPDGGQWVADGGGGSGGGAEPAGNLLRRDAGSKIDANTILTTVPGARAAVADVERKLYGQVPTDAHVDQGGFRTADGHWTPERAAVHDRILRDIFNRDAVARAIPAPGQQPTLYLFGGRGGSGKSWLAGPNGPVNPNNAIMINSDDIREEFLRQYGYEGWNSALYHEEASHIADRAEQWARSLGLNVIYDATMRTPGGSKARVAAYKKAGYKVKGYYMYASPKVAATRATERFLRTGRFVPPDYILNSTSNERTFDSLRPEFSSWQVYDNNRGGGGGPTLVASGGT